MMDGSKLGDKSFSDNKSVSAKLSQVLFKSYKPADYASDHSRHPFISQYKGSSLFGQNSALSW